MICHFGYPCQIEVPSVSLPEELQSDELLQAILPERADCLSGSGELRFVIRSVEIEQQRSAVRIKRHLLG